MYGVWLKSFPPPQLHTFERVVRKNQRSTSDKDIHDLLIRVQYGTPALVRFLPVREAADNLVKECAQHGGVAEVWEHPDE